MAQQVSHIQLRQSAVVVVLRILFIQGCLAALSVALHLLDFWLAGTGQLFVALQIVILLAAASLQLFNAILLVTLVLNWVSTTYTITPTEIIAERGIFTLQRSVYKGSHVEEVDVHQGVLGKLCNYGTIKFFNPVLKQDVFLMNIPKPLKYAEIMKRFDNNERILFFPEHAENARN